MAVAIKMPALGESVTEGTVTAWLKHVGDKIEADEPIVEVATDKVDSEVPSPIAGILLEILVEEDETVEVGTTVAMVGEAGESSSTSGFSSESPVVKEAPKPVIEDTPPAPAPEASVQVPNKTETTEIKMPALGESVTEGTVTAWLKHVGDKIEADEPIVEVATDKVDSEVPSPIAGILSAIRVDEDQTAAVGDVIAIISSNAAPETKEEQAPPAPSVGVVLPKRNALAAPAAPPAPAPTRRESRMPAPGAAGAPVGPPPPAPSWANSPSPEPGDAQAYLDDLATRAAATGKIVAPADAASANSSSYVTPLVRKLARDEGIDLKTVKGSGVGGRIRKEDVLEAVKARASQAGSHAAPRPAITASPLRGTTQKMSRLRQTVARHMVDSLQNAAQLTTVVEVDVTKVASLRSRVKDSFQEQYGTKLSFLPFFVKAATEGLIQHPKLNAVINSTEVTYFDHENIGIAVDTDRGLMVPVIKNAGELDLAGIAKEINSLASKARGGKIAPDELTGSTFTITNTGSGGALFDTPVLNSPEVGILGVGAIVKRPVVVTDADGNEAIAVHSMVYLSLTYDHRLVDGADAARYLTTVKQRLEAGDFEADL